MKMRQILYVVALGLSLSEIAVAGGTTPVNVPTFTPWGALLTAAVLGISGAYILLKRRK